ncbi:MAG: Ser-Thr-rich GPI-anchored membrane family protein [Thermodesulfobacteriota bacterium]
MKKGRIILLLIGVFFLFCFSCKPPETLPDQGITILGPKANDVVPAGATYEIQWKAEVPDSEFGANVTIEFSKDGGKSWEKVGENIPNTGKYSWSVPKIDSAQCKILINSQYRPKYRKTSDVFTVK